VLEKSLVRTYLAERYLPQPAGQRFAQAVADAEHIANGTGLRLVTSMLLPGHELALFLDQAPSLEVDVDAHRQPGVLIDRIAEAVHQERPVRSYGWADSARLDREYGHARGTQSAWARVG
jgi:hypothetical protein